MAMSAQKHKPIGKTLLFGAATAALYGVVFAYSDAVLGLFTRGGAYAALPIATVFVFSFVHGSFAHNLWSMLGVEPRTMQPETRTTAPVRRPAQRPRPRLRLSLR